MSTVLDALRKAEQGGVRGGGYLGAPPPEPPRRGRRFLWILLGIVALVAAFAGGLELSGESDRKDEAVAVKEDAPAREEKALVHDEVARPGEPPIEVAKAEPLESEPPQRREAHVATKPPEAVPAPVPTLEVLTTAAKNERRERTMQRILERREERAARRGERQALRDNTKDLKDAIRSAPSTQDRDVLRAEFMKQRQEARLQRRAGLAEKRAERAEAALAASQGAGQPPANATGAAATAGSAPPSAPQVVAPPPLAPAPEPPPPAAPRPPADGNAATTRAAPPPPPPPGEPSGASSRTGMPPPGPPDGGHPPGAERFEIGGASPEALAHADAAGSPAPGGSGSGEVNPLRRAPSGAPQVRINILQYSPDPARRFAYVSVEGAGAMTQVREGESYEGLTVRRILPEMVEFANSTSTFLLRAN